ncbi:uncharacterized protein LOC126660353 [Mercurialis annua]|uniref:uncharacterized protein LOC126660353 n=1 Tax=Mercurialis annua TaxID=3986 RepID=UPI00215F88D0|nr:uncharacterized protein LOC126660353 [Mercurialis annua]
MTNSRNGNDFSNGDDFTEPSSFSTGVETSTVRSELTERLTDILVEEGDGDLLLQRSDREDRVLVWLQALDMQVMGACRADERLKPLLKMNASCGIAEDSLLAHLSQHFEPSEVGILARCFCIPLVSIRVGKINKQGTLLCPTSSRGNLNLTLLPTSDLRLSFIGDDGHAERLFTLSSKAQGPAVKVDEISADSSGRSFIIKIADGRDFHFWCSEKSKLLGIELLAKMKDILRRRPSIVDLTGISESRLGCFATHLRAFLVGSGTRENAAHLPISSSSSTTECEVSSKSLRSRYIGSQAVKANASYQGSLSPRSSSFKEGLPKSLSSLRTREKLKRRGDGHLSAVDSLMIPFPCEKDESSSNVTEDVKPTEIKSSPVTPPSSFLESLGKLAIPPILSSGFPVTISNPPLASPYYCWCPLGTSTVQFPSASSQLSVSSIESSPLLPPLSSLLSASLPSSIFTPTPPLSLADIPKLDFPAFLPDPLLRLPMSSTPQFPTFTPLMCDPIVHIPVIDVCSSGQGYLVSAGPCISSTIPPLHPLIPETDSLLEKGARETLRLLMSSSAQVNHPQLLNVLPAVLTSTGEKQCILAVGSRGLYTGSSDVDAIMNRMARIGLVSLSQSTITEINAAAVGNCDNVDGVLDDFGDEPNCSYSTDERGDC